jgi:hypothetical protein
MALNKEKIVTFFDSIGRTIIGEQVDEKSNDKVLAVKNPVIIHVIPNEQTGQMALQLLPAFFKEFQADRNEESIWSFNRCQIAVAEPITFDERLYAQYEQMFSSIIVPEGAGQVVTPDSVTSPKGEKVQLFND